MKTQMIFIIMASLLVACGGESMRSSIVAIEENNVPQVLAPEPGSLIPVDDGTAAFSTQSLSPESNTFDVTFTIQVDPTTSRVQIKCGTREEGDTFYYEELDRGKPGSVPDDGIIQRTITGIPKNGQDVILRVWHKPANSSWIGADFWYTALSN